MMEDPQPKEMEHLKRRVESLTKICGCFTCYSRQFHFFGKIIDLAYSNLVTFSCLLYFQKPFATS